jgi:hypothetical protein
LGEWLLSDEYWDRWFRRRRRPDFRRFFFDDIDEVFREMQEMIDREFKELTERVPSDLIRERSIDRLSPRRRGPLTRTAC